ncbi:MAG: response regulator transcription factor [Coriobacteriia bacterium]|nr:response regulator transcription factor [Coriobacteriia bacterium]
MKYREPVPSRHISLRTMTVLTLGFASIGIWFQLVGYSSILTLPPDAEPLPFGRIAFLSAIIVVMLSGIFRPGLIDNHHLSLRLVMPPVLLAGTGMSLLAYHQTLVRPLNLAVPGCALMGLGYAWFLLAWYRALVATRDVRTISIILMGAGALRLVMPLFLSSGLPQPWPLLATVALPLLSLAALFLVEEMLEDQSQVTENPAPPAIERVQIMQLAALGFGLIVLRALGSGGIWGDSRMISAVPLAQTILVYGAGTAIFIGVGYVTITRRAIKPLSVLNRVPMLIAIAGFLVLSFLLPNYRGALVTAVFAVFNEGYYQMLFGVVLVTSAGVLRFPATRVLGATFTLTYSLSLFWLFVFENAAPLPNTIMLVAAYVLVIVTALYSVRSTEPADNKWSAWEQQDASNADYCEELAAEYDLSPREKDVFCLLAKGRSLPFIQEELFLSEGTIRTHVSHIYQKLGVHSRQDLISIASSKNRKSDGGLIN